MHDFRAQAAIEWRAATARSQLGQGATEYLVLLAAVLIIALVTIALLGWFPGLSKDISASESQTYWKSGGGGGGSISIVEMSAAPSNATFPGASQPYLLLRNTGSYPITLTKIYGTKLANYNANMFFTGMQEWITIYKDVALVSHNLTEITIPPGETTCFGYLIPPNNAPLCGEHRFIIASQYYLPYSQYEQLTVASSACNQDGTGNVVVKDFGFEYMVTIEGKAITERQIGKTLILPCHPP